MRPAAPALCTINVHDDVVRKRRTLVPAGPSTGGPADRAEGGWAHSQAGVCPGKKPAERSVCVRTRVQGTGRRNLFDPKRSPVQSRPGQARNLGSRVPIWRPAEAVGTDPRRGPRHLLAGRSPLGWWGGRRPTFPMDGARPPATSLLPEPQEAGTAPRPPDMGSGLFSQRLRRTPRRPGHPHATFARFRIPAKTPVLETSSWGSCEEADSRRHAALLVLIFRNMEENRSLVLCLEIMPFFNSTQLSQK